MIKKSKYVTLFGITTSLFASSVSAQSVHSLNRYGERDMRSSVSLTIPLGGPREAATSKPQLSLSFQQQRRQRNPYNYVPDNIDLRSNTYDLQPRQVRIGFTLDQSPQLMMNGKPYALPDDKANASTLGKVGIGAAAIAGVVVVAFGVLYVATVTSDPAE